MSFLKLKKSSSLSYLLILIISLFFLFTIFIQFFYLNSSSEDLVEKKCKKYLNLDLHIDDLKRMKQSYLDELEKIESKRNLLMEKVSNLKDHLHFLRNDLDDLIKKKSLNNMQILSQIIKLNQLETKIEQKQKIYESIQIKSNLTTLNFTNKPSRKSIESCVRLDKCFLGDKFKLFIFNQDFLNKLDLSLTNNSIEFTSKPEDACFSLIISTQANFDLDQFLSKYASTKNILFINFKPSLNLTENLSDCFLLASFSQNSDLNFGILDSNSNYDLFKIEPPELINNRKYLLSYLDKNNSSKLSLVNSFFKDNPSINLNLNCEIDILTNLCYNLNYRLEVLYESKFNLLIPDEGTEVSVIQRLIESLHSGSIPILLDLDYKLPLDDLIKWDEIVLRISIQKLNHLISIIQNLNFYEHTSRQIKLRNVYNHYFSSLTKQFKTLIAGLQNKLSIWPMPIRDYESKEFNFNLISKQVINEQEKVEKEDVEYLGEINQIPLDSDTFLNNLTQSSYKQWNVFYQPFYLFKSTPFDNLFQSERPIMNNSTINAYLYPDEEFTYGGGDGKYFPHFLSGNYKQEQFTIVILAFKREFLLLNSLENYLKLPYLNSIIIIWNPDVNKIEPSENLVKKFGIYLLNKKLIVLKMNENSLNNRFLPLNVIKTDAILNLDDDVQLRADEIMFAFRVWRENRDRIVGFPARYHSWNFKSRGFHYKSYLSCEYSMVLTGAAFYHRFYNYYYSYVMDSRIRVKVNELMNCEDIAFNMMVSHLTRKPPIKVTTKYNFICSECETAMNETMSMNWTYLEQTELPVSLKRGHLKRRTEGLQYFLKIYGYNPLLYSQFRADSVLYKTKLPKHKQKCFKYI